MRRAIVAGLFATAFVMMKATPARAADQWSLIGGNTVASGTDMIYGEFGWPDASFGWIHGIGSRADFGARFSLLYGYESTTYTQFGVGLRFPLRFQLTRGGKVDALFHFDPGFKLYAFRPVHFGLQFPVGFQIGIHASSDATVALGIDVPLTVYVTPGTWLIASPMFGPGFEYHVDRNLGISLNTRFGASIFASDRYCGYYGCGSRAEFAFVTQLGVMYHF